MKFKFAVENGKVNTEQWDAINKKLEQDLLNFASGRVNELAARLYLEEMVKALRPVEKERDERMLFLMFDRADTMPADARVEYVYKPTYIAATIMMTAMHRYAALCRDAKLRMKLKQLLQACIGRHFVGSGWQDCRGLIDTLRIFAQGDTVNFMKAHREINEDFAAELEAAFRYLKEEICTGKVRDPWSGDDYGDEGRSVLKLLEEKPKKALVWYACYGSNLKKERFMRYIDACDDVTPPVESRPFVFDHPIYFAKTAQGWSGKGKAFLDTEHTGKAYGRIYLITAEQYEQVKQQEGPDYRRQLSLGEIEGKPVFSFTDTQRNEPLNIPSEAYFQTILDGLKECYEGILSQWEMVNYLVTAIFHGNTFVVAKAIKQSAHCISVQNICRVTGLTHAKVRVALEWLLQHHVIVMDGRSAREGHTTRDLQAAFYTQTGDSARGLLSAMLGAFADAAADKR